MVVVVIISVISAVGYPRFQDWKNDREVRLAAENIVTMINGIVSQSKRGSFPYVQLYIDVPNSDGSGDKTFETRGMSQKKFIQERAALGCSDTASNWDKEKVHFYKADVLLNIVTDGKVCFSKDSTFYETNDNLKTNSIVLCQKSVKQPTKCKDKPTMPAYKVIWNRFGGTTLKKWSGDENSGQWTDQ